MPHSPSLVRFALSATFFANGCLGATWLIHIPGIKARLGLSDGQLGLALWAAAIGLFLGMLSSGPVMARFGSRLGTWLATGSLALVTTLPIATPSYFLLFPALFFWGLFNGLMDSCMNAQAAHLQKELGRPIMSSIHSCWSIGSFTGAAVGGLLIAAGTPPPVHAACIGLFFIGATVWIRTQLLEDEERSDAAFHIALPKGPLLPLGIMCFIAMLSEGAVADWSGVHLKETFGRDAATATLGYNAFFFLMFVSRFIGDGIIARFGVRRTAITGLTLAAVGFAIASLTNNFFVAVIGFGLSGFAIANSVPLIFAAAATQGKGLLGHSIAAVATVGYLGFFAGPPLIGAVAEATALPVGLSLVGLLLMVAAVMGISVLRPSRDIRTGEVITEEEVAARE
jgi:MFS family permease